MKFIVNVPNTVSLMLEAHKSQEVLDWVHDRIPTIREHISEISTDGHKLHVVFNRDAPKVIVEHGSILFAEGWEDLEKGTKEEATFS